MTREEIKPRIRWEQVRRSEGESSAAALQRSSEKVQFTEEGITLPDYLSRRTHGLPNSFISLLGVPLEMIADEQILPPFSLIVGGLQDFKDD